jgi:putative ABC transport system permease protein
MDHKNSKPMIRQIIKIIGAQRANNAWIWAEMLLVSVFLWYIVDTLYVHLRTYLAPAGFQIDHTYLIGFRAVSDDSYQYLPPEKRTTSTADDLLTMMDRIRTYPGVEAVSLSEAAHPYNMGSSANSLRRNGTDMGNVQRRRVTPGFFRVFRIAAPGGETSRLTDNLAFDQLIISTEVEKALYPEGNATGKDINYADFNSVDSISYRVGAVCTPLRFDDFHRPNPSFFLLFSEKMMQQEVSEAILPGLEVCLRVTPEADRDFISRFRVDMAAQLRYNNLYMLNIRPFSEVREHYIRDRVNDFKMSLAVIAFLLVNIFLGMVGTFWFRTQQRQGEMGLRIALGATGRKLQSMLMLEGLVLLLFAFLPAMLVSLNVCLRDLINTDLMPLTAGRFLLCQGITFGLIAAMISFGILYPAVKTARLQPVEALHYE